MYTPLPYAVTRITADSMQELFMHDLM